MKYFLRILAFLFISFVFCYSSPIVLGSCDTYRLNVNYGFNISEAVDSSSIFIKFSESTSDFERSKKLRSFLINGRKYFFPDFSVHLYGFGISRSTGKMFAFVQHSTYTGDYFAYSRSSVNSCDNFYQHIDSGYSILGKYKNTTPIYSVLAPSCDDKEQVYSEKLGKCIPKCVNPENGEQGYYNDEKARCEFCSFGATFDEETETCSNWKCFELENKMERFDCMCREGGHGAGVNSQILVTVAGTDCSITCEDGFRISTISNFNVFKQLFDTVFNGGYIQTTFSDTTKFCTVDNSTNIDLVDPSDSESEQGGSQGGEQGGEQGGSQTAEQGGSQGGGQQGGVSKGTITIKDPVTGEEKVVEIGKNEKENSISYRDPETGNQVEIKPKDETGGNIITITDTITGETKTVEIGKNDNRKNEISYKDPYTGKDVIIELSPKDTDKTDNSQAESGKADNSQAEGDKKNNDDFEFKGPNLGALGNANDFDEGGLLSGLNDELDSLSDDNLGFLESIIDNITSYIDDLKGSLDNVAEKASALSDNPFSSSNVTSCAIDFSLLDKSIKIDLCQYISQFKNLFYAIFYLALNVFIAFGMFRLFVLILVSI